MNSPSESQRPSTANRASTSARRIGKDNATVGTTSDDLQHQPTSPRAEAMMDLGLTVSDIDASSTSISSPRSLGFFFPSFVQDVPPTLESPEHAHRGSNASPLEVTENTHINANDFAPELWNMDMFWHYLRPLPSSLDLSMSNDHSQIVPPIPQNREDEAERIAYLFHQEIAHRLSIEEEKDQNPWRTLIWPLTKEYPALYHAIAALTCFGTSKQYPQMQPEGTRHVHKSTQLLSENVEKGEIPLDAALAATLALGFAET